MKISNKYISGKKRQIKSYLGIYINKNKKFNKGIISFSQIFFFSFHSDPKVFLLFWKVFFFILMILNLVT